MDAWDQDFVDLLEPGHFSIRADGSGSFVFGAVQGGMDCRKEDAEGGPRLAFTWEGCDEMDPASGRGWIQVDGGELTGHIFFHLGDDSGFRAKRPASASPTR